jgi:hypothetical protein
LLAGCDLAFGVGGDPDPCTLSAFDDAPVEELVAANDFSVDWDQTFAIVARETGAFEVSFAGGEKPIDLGVYVNAGFSLAPEGNALFFTAMIEPPLLQGAVRLGEVWTTAPALPPGRFAGTPSADVFGPRRVLVTVDGNVLEFEDDAGRWVGVGTAHPLDIARAPNLAPNGLTAVYEGADGIYAMTRPTTNDWFGEPVKILAGADRSPQLLGQCKRLYTTHDNMLRRYQR